MRAGRVDEPARWPWSSYRAHVGQVPPPEWLDSVDLHAHLLGHPVCGVANERRATQRYVALLAASRDVRLRDEALRQQIDLGDEAFVERTQALAVHQQEASRDVPRPQRNKPLTLSQWLGSSESRDRAFLCTPSSLSDLGQGKSANFTMRDEKAGFPRFSGFSRAFPWFLPTVDAMRPSASNSTPSKPASTRQ